MITINKPGRTREDLLKSLEDIKSSFKPQIEQYNLQVTSIPDGYNLKGKKKVLFIDFSADIKITAQDGKFVINYETNNIPQSKINETLAQVRGVLEKC
ncbi:MAG: hypothetical protein ABI792_07760 [bacterium]